MKIRFGYVAMSTMLENASPSKNVTAKSFFALAEKDREAALNKVRRTASENLSNTLRILLHNKAYGIEIYRFSSKIIPLATHPLLYGWDYTAELSSLFKAIGCFVNKNKLRVSFHPDHFTVLNSPNEEILQSSLKDLQHHCLLLKEMGLDEGTKLVIHVGGTYNDREKSINRFLQNWSRIPQTISERLCIENDDRTYTASEVLNICHKLSLLMVLDLHHYKCNNNNEGLTDILPGVFETWSKTGLPPKIHVSSPKSPHDPRSHHDYVNPRDLYGLIKLSCDLTDNLDVMVEAKQKDKAMLKLVEDLAGYPFIKKTGLASLNFS